MMRALYHRYGVDLNIAEMTNGSSCSSEAAPEGLGL